MLEPTYWKTRRKRKQLMKKQSMANLSSVEGKIESSANPGKKTTLITRVRATYTLS